MKKLNEKPNHPTAASPAVDTSAAALQAVQNLLDYSIDVICAVDAQGCFTYATAAARDLWGYEPYELIGKNYMDMVVPEYRASTAVVAETLKRGAKVTHFKNRYLKKNGDTVPVLWSAKWDEKSQTMYCVAKDATAIQEAEEKTKQVESRLYKAYQLGRIGWWEWDNRSGAITLSDEMYAIYGLTREACPVFTPESFMALVHPEDLANVLHRSGNLHHQQFDQFEHRMIKPSGEVVHVIHYVETELDAAGEFIRMHGITKDITERKQAELQLKASEQKLTTILESIGDCFFAVDRSWTVTYWNRKAEELLQKSREDIVGKNLWVEYASAIPLKFYEEYHRAVAENIIVHFEEFFHPLNLWIEVSAYPSADGLSVYFKDISERVKVQNALQESNQRYALVSKATSDAIWDWDIEQNTLYWGEGFQTNFGYTPDSYPMPIEAWAEGMHPDERHRVERGLQAALEGTATTWKDEYRYRRADGRYAIVIDRGFVIRNSDGKAVRMVGALQDVTGQKEAEILLKTSEEQFRLLFHKSPRPKWMFHEESFRIVEANTAALELYGYTKEEFTSLHLTDLHPEPAAPQLYAVREQGISYYQAVVQHRKKNGEVFSIDIASHAIDLPAGRHFIVEGKDVTEKLRMQQLLMEEKVTAQKEVAKAIIQTQERERSEIAKELHDNVNQLITTAKLYIENIGYFPGQQEEFVQKSVDLLQRSIKEIRLLSKQLVTPVINDIGFKATLDELLLHYSALNVFETDLHYCLNEDRLDKDLQLTIYRIVQEQLNNIVKYAKASRVCVTVAELETGVHIRITDDGIGFDTTRATRGLGLNNMKNRTEVYKGHLNIDSAPGKGTILTVCLPHQVGQRA